MKLQLNVAAVLQAVLVALIVAAMLGGYNFVVDMRQFQGQVIAELRRMQSALAIAGVQAERNRTEIEGLKSRRR